MISIFELFFVFAVRLSTCLAVDVEYSEKVVSDHKRDGFGWSLATSYHKLVIGAPRDDLWRGSVMVEEGVRVKGAWSFGDHVDMNQQFMVVSCRDPYRVNVYQSNSPYDLVASFPMMDDYVCSLVISDDNTIAVSNYDHSNSWLTIYQYEGSSTWNIAKNFKLEDWGDSVAVYGDIIVVGIANTSHVRMFKRV